MILPPKNRCQYEATEIILPPAVAIIATKMILPPGGGTNSHRNDIATGGGNNSHRSDIDTSVDSMIATCRGDSYYHLIATIYVIIYS